MRWLPVAARLTARAFARSTDFAPAGVKVEMCGHVECRTFYLDAGGYNEVRRANADTNGGTFGRYDRTIHKMSASPDFWTRSD